MTEYTQLAALKSDLGLDDDDEDRNAALTASILAASRAIDLMTNTTFGSDTASARLYVSDGTCVRVDKFTSTTGLVVKTGRDGDFSTTISASDYVLWPYNAVANGAAYKRIDTPRGLFQTQNDRPTVQVTAIWGYDTVPAGIERACRIKAARLFRRKDSPEGAIGTAEFGVMSIGNKREDPDVWSLLEPYCTPGMA